MIQRLAKSAFILVCVLIFTPTPVIAGTSRDVVLLVDDSGTGATNIDYVRSGIGELLHGLTGDVRIAALTFNQDTHAITPLRPLTDDHIEQISTYLRETDYTREPSNSALALERAIYELKNNARDSADKLIIVVGSGHIDTGDSIRDTELSAWTRSDLTSEAQSQGIRVFWIVPEESADFSLIQAVTHKSGGTYFRATTPEDFYAALARLVVLLATPAQTPEARGAPPPGLSEIDIPEWIKTPPRYVLAIVAGAVLSGIVGLTIGMRRQRGNRRTPRRAIPGEPPATESPALLKDLSGFTGKTDHALMTTLTKISRRPAGDNTSSHTIVIGDGSVSRNHALIEFRDGDHWITDMGSINGTFVNNRRISEETCLEDGDLLRFARYEFEYRRNDKRTMGQTIFAKARFLKPKSREIPAPSGAAEPIENVSVSQDADHSGTNKDVTLLRPKK